MKKLCGKTLAFLLAMALTVSLSVSALAFEFPDAYWPLQKEWIAAVEANDGDKIIDVTQKTYDLLIPSAPDETVYNVLEPMCGLTSWAYEVQGDLDNAVLWQERQLEMDHWFVKNGKPNYQDLVLNGNARMDYLTAARDVTVYALTNFDPSPYKVGPNTGVWYGMATATERDEGSAAIFYLRFQEREDAAYWINYYTNTSSHFRRALQGGVIECAWNYAFDAGSQDVLSADDYIAETLATLGGLNATVLLRLGAEVNNWGNTDADLYIRAFRKIATAARQYPNLQIVYSPDMINNRTVNAEMYYPGDEYVDWVGISAYHRTNYRNNKGELPGAFDMAYRTRGSYGNDAYYGQGFYDYDPLVAMKHVADLANAHNKPMMVSECGFTNNSARYGDATAYAADQINKFYSYLNMVYPQIKAAFYFDQNNMATAEAQDYSITDKPELEKVYHAAISGNRTYLEDPHGVAAGWEPLNETNLHTNLGTVRLATYASFPNVANATVKYYVDGTLAATVTEAPYYYDLNTSQMTVGPHTIQVTAAGGQFARTKTYTLNVPAYAADKSNDKLAVDGKAVDPAIYKVNDANYFRLRDVAMLLNGTPAQFDIVYDEILGVTIQPGKAYTPLGWELLEKAKDHNTARISTDKVAVNGEQKEFNVFKIDEVNYFQIRDLASILGFTVGWDAVNGITITTGK